MLRLWLSQFGDVSSVSFAFTPAGQADLLMEELAKNLATSSSAYAEMFSTFSNEERRRRGMYQAEWAGKLPWELPGLDEGLAFIEVEMRSSHSSLGSVKRTECQVTMEDLEGLEHVLLDMQENLSPEDMPSNGQPHPVQETTTLIRKLKRNIENLSSAFERLNRSKHGMSAYLFMSATEAPS